MSENKKQSSNKLLIVIIILLIVVICIGGIVAAILISKSSEKNEEVSNSTSAMKNDGYIILDSDDLKKAEEDAEKTKAGSMRLRFKDTIIVENGKNGTCDISNPSVNNYDMYVTLWLDETEEEIYRSGLIPLGARIEQLELNRALEPGEYPATLVYNQVENDEVVSQINVAVILSVQS
jgi:hypothetical protein